MQLALYWVKGYFYYPFSLDMVYIFCFGFVPLIMATVGTYWLLSILRQPVDLPVEGGNILQPLAWSSHAENWKASSTAGRWHFRKHTQACRLPSSKILQVELKHFSCGSFLSGYFVHDMIKLMYFPGGSLSLHTSICLPWCIFAQKMLELFVFEICIP